MAKNLIFPDRDAVGSPSLHREEYRECPICYEMITADKIETHADYCADSVTMTTQDEVNEHNNSFSSRELTPGGTDKSCENSKRKVWNLEIENSFEESDIQPSKRKRVSQKNTNNSDERKMKPVYLGPYPVIDTKNARGCLKNQGNNPGLTVQSFLQGKRKTPTKNSSPSSTQEQSSVEVVKSMGFKLHPFLAKKNSISEKKNSGAYIQNALLPDGEGGFVINDSAFDVPSSSDEPLRTLTLPTTSGFIDFKNQFKEITRGNAGGSRQKSSPKKKKRTWKGSGSWRGKLKRRGSNKSRRGK